MVINLKTFLEDNGGQTAAEMVLLFGGVIVIAIIAIGFYSDYTDSVGSSVTSDSEDLAQNITNLKDKF